MIKLKVTLFAFLLLNACSGGDSDSVQDVNFDLNTISQEILIRRDQPLMLNLQSITREDEENSIFKYIWDFGDGNYSEGGSVVHRYSQPGCYQVSLSTFSGDQEITKTTKPIRIVGGNPEILEDFQIDGIPSDNDLIPRDTETNTGYINLEINYPNPNFETLIVRTYVNGQVDYESKTELCGEFKDIEIPIFAERQERNIDISLSALGKETKVGSAERIIAGDMFLVNGQSNAVSREFLGSADENLDRFVRSYGSRSEYVEIHELDSLWHTAVVGESVGGPGAIGQWPLRMARELSLRFNMPIGVINSGHGDRQISYFQRNDLNPLDLNTNYGRALDRTIRSKAMGKVRAILFYQGESDKGNAIAHKEGFTELYRDWSDDYYDIEKIYITQIRSGCGGQQGGQLETREAQRQLAENLPKISIMSTTGLDGHDGCHFSYENGYRELGDRYANLISRDLYSSQGEADLEPINVVSATLDSDIITIKTSSDASKLIINEGIESSFQLHGGTRSILSIRRQGNDLLVDLGPGENPSMIGYGGHSGSGPWIINAKGVGLLAFLLPIN